VPIHAISSAAHTGITELLRVLAQTVAHERAALRDLEEADDAHDESIPTISLSGAARDDAWQVEQTDDGFTVSGAKIEKFAARTDFGTRYRS
jgi:hypothetical protein